MAKKVLSPHLTIYEPQVSSVFSIFHRITGATITLAFVGTMVWSVAKLALPVDVYVGPYWLMLVQYEDELFKIIVFVLTWCLCYHINNALRHFIWDLGFGFSNASVKRSAMAALFSTTLLFFVVVWFFILPTFFV
mgnify:CR=1 FL=1|jgi:succinate dehydrogenase / fumarate reductase, cytochrome b subunit